MGDGVVGGLRRDVERRCEVSDTPIPPSKCLMCGEPARLAIGAEDVYAAHCSDACAVEQWNLEQLHGRITIVGELTEKSLDEALSTTGIPSEDLS
ncbi:MAG: hypothetical protein AB7E70_19475 [Hyphomicrobiaceae bacterium]